MPLTFYNMLLRHIFVFLFLLPLFSEAQTPIITSLKKQLLATSTDLQKIKLNDSLGRQYEEINIDSCFFFLNKSLQIAQKTNDLRATANAMYRLGYTYLFISKEESKALYWLSKSILIAKKNNFYDIVSRCLQLMGIIAEHQNVMNVIDYYEDAIKYALKANNRKVLADAYEIKFTYYFNRKMYQESEKCLLKSMQLVKEYDIDSWFAEGLDYCDVLTKMNQKSKALAFAHELNLQKDKLKKSKGDFVYLNDLGKLEFYLTNYSKAESYFQEALDRENQKVKADTFHLYFIFTNLETLYLAKQDYQKAYNANKNNTTIRLWLAQKRLTKDAHLQIIKQKAALDLEKKEIEISLLAKQKKQQTFFLITAIIVALILISLLLVLQRNKQRIEQQKAELTQINANKDKLFSIIAHDLREPMASFKGLLQLIEEEALTQQEFRDLSKSLKQNVDNIHAMLENLLLWSLSQMNGIKPNSRNFDVGDSLHETVAFFKDVATQKQIELKTYISESLMAYADENQIQTVIRNLLNNAIKFTPQNGVIKVIGEHINNQISLKVIDSGKGMNPDELQNLFTKPKIKRGTAGEKGTGLGLILCKELVEQNQGNISVSSIIGKGTSFEISLLPTV